MFGTVAAARRPNIPLSVAVAVLAPDLGGRESLHSITPLSQTPV